MDITTGFTELRLSLADARDKLRQAKDAHEIARAEAEQRAIDSGQAGGKNEPERQRNQLLALQQDTAYLAALKALRSAEANVDRLEALLEGARDARRVDEWRIRAQLAEALGRAGVASDSPDRSGDGAFDDGLGQQVDQAVANYAAVRRPRTVAFEDEDLPF